MGVKDDDMNITTYNNGNNMIYKSNELIESCYNLTVAQNRLIYLAMTKLNTIILEKNLNIEEVENRIKKAQFELIFISVLDYKKTFNIKSNNLYKELADLAGELFDEKILYLKPNGDFGEKRWVITCEYNHEGKGISLEFHPAMIKSLLILRSEYTGMLFENFANKLKGKYSFRIYELCKQYLKIGKRDFEVEDLRFKLKLMDNEYAQYRDFKRMISNAIKEINKGTDIYLEYEEIEKVKATKKVVKIRFKIKSQDQQLSLFDENNDSTNYVTQNQVNIISDLIGYKVSAQQSRDILTSALTTIDKNPELKNVKVRDYISEKVKVCKEYIAKKGTDDYIGLLISAINKDWRKNIVIPPSKKKVEQKKQPNSGFNNFEPRPLEDRFIELRNKMLSGQATDEEEKEFNEIQGQGME